MKRFVVFVLLMTALSVQAQKNNVWRKINDALTIVKNIDTLYIYHPEQSLTVGMFTTLQQAGFDVKVKFKINLDEDNVLSGVSKYTLKERLCTKLGFEVGYGKLCFGYGFSVGPKSAFKKRAFAFNLLGKAWGVHFSYFNINNPFLSSLEIGSEGESEYLKDDIYASEPAMLRYFAIDGYYVFNNKRFAYPVAYKAGLVQRRTAGSWMVTARYMQGDLRNSPQASYDSYNLLDCFSTMQASLGGGYSVNVVCWHKDPKGTLDKGLRNLTLNLTALPVITFFNYLKTTAYEFDEEGNNIGQNVSKIYCYPMPNFIGSASLSMTLDRFFISTQFVYNWFYFRSTDAYNASKLQIPDGVDDIVFRGSFHDWTLKVLFVYKFPSFVKSKPLNL
jgi:hypothetical protein